MAPSNTLPTHGNEKTMNLNHLVLTNIQSSPYFKVNLFDLKTYHEVIDEIYYKVSHLEPWEKGSRKTAGQTGMCGGVRGVGAGGIVSSAFCLLYKLYTLKLTRKQLQGLLNHADSPYIRGLGFMYIRFSQPPADFWEWLSPYLEDDEEIDVKAGGGHSITMGEMVRQFMTKLDWYATLFPRIPVPVQKDLEIKLREYDAEMRQHRGVEEGGGPGDGAGGGRGQHDAGGGGGGYGGQERGGGQRGGDSPSHRGSDYERDRKRQRSRSRSRGHRRSKSAERRRRSRSREKHRSRSRDRGQRSHDKDKRNRSRSRERSHRHHGADTSSSSSSHHRSSNSNKRDRSSRDRHLKSSRDERHRSSPDRHHHHHHSSRDSKRSRDTTRENSFERDLARERERQKRDRDRYN